MSRSLKQVGRAEFLDGVRAVFPYVLLVTSDPVNLEKNLIKTLGRVEDDGRDRGTKILVFGYDHARGFFVADEKGFNENSFVWKYVPDDVVEAWREFNSYGSVISYVTGVAAYQGGRTLAEDVSLIVERMREDGCNRLPVRKVVFTPGLAEVLSGAYPDNEDVGYLVSAIAYGASHMPSAGITLVVPSSTSENLPGLVEQYFYKAQWKLPESDELARQFERELRARVNAVSRTVKKGEADVMKRALEEALQDGDFSRSVASNALGMDQFNFSNALSLAFVKMGLDFEWLKAVKDPVKWREVKNRFCNLVWDQKVQYITDARGLELYRPTEQDRFDMIGGYEFLKAFLKLTARNPLSKGVLLVGVPGTGKTATAKALGYELDVPVLKLQLQGIYQGIVGSTEANLYRLLQVVERMAPCILIVDEIEKQLSGAASSHLTDGGVTSRVMGVLLEWLNDRPSGVYVVGTSNNLQLLPPEFLRTGRWDAIFYFDYPSPREREQIWKIWRKYFNIPEEAELPDDDRWTGSDVHQCCKLARILLDSLGGTGVDDPDVQRVLSVTGLNEITPVNVLRVASLFFDPVHTKVPEHVVKNARSIAIPASIDSDDPRLKKLIASKNAERLDTVSFMDIS